MKVIYFIFVFFFGTLISNGFTPLEIYAGAIDADFPDVIACKDNYSNSPSYLYLSVNDESGLLNGYGSSSMAYSGGNWTTNNSVVFFYPDGSFAGVLSDLSGQDCDGYSISDLYLTGQAIDFGSTPPISQTNSTYLLVSYNSTTTCITDNDITTCTQSSTSPPIEVTSDNIIFALSVILFFVVIAWLGFMFSPFKKSL